MSNPRESATVDESLRLGHGFEADERDRIVTLWRNLDARLRSFRPGTVDLELSVKNRDSANQQTVLEASVHGFPRMLATSSRTDLSQALNEVRDDLVRQLTDAKNRLEPRNNRQLRASKP